MVMAAARAPAQVLRSRAAGHPAHAGARERLTFVLHDTFDDIAAIVGRSAAAARQLASRGRRRVQGVAPSRVTGFRLTPAATQPSPAASRYAAGTREAHHSSL